MSTRLMVELKMDYAERAAFYDELRAERPNDDRIRGKAEGMRLAMALLDEKLHDELAQVPNNEVAR